MAKPEWGTKRQCPKCGERFYDLNKPFPLTCVACGQQFEPEVILKSKQSPQEDPKPRKLPKAEPGEDADEDLLDDDIELEGEEEEDDILGDVDLDDDDDVTDVIEKPRKAGDEI